MSRSAENAAFELLRPPANAPDREGTRQHGDPLRLVPFRGGAMTDPEKALIPAGGYSMIRNMRCRHPGFEQRAGCRKQHSTADGTNRALSLYQFSKGERTERHLFAQMSDGDILKASNMPPVVTTGVFGTEVFSGSTGQKPASWCHVNDIMLMAVANGTDQMQFFAGDDNYVEKLVKFSDSAAAGNIPDNGEDMTLEVTDGLTTTCAVLDALGTYAAATYECLFIFSPVPATKLTWTVSKANGTASVATLNYRKNDNTLASTSMTDNTADSGATLAQSGTMTWSAPSDEIPWHMYGKTGYWYQLTVSVALDAEVEVTALTYGSSGTSAFRDIANVWNGVPPFAIEARFYDQSAGTYALFATDTIDISEMTHSADDSVDRLHFNSNDEIMGVYVDVGETPNTSGSTTVGGVKVWTGTAFEAVSNVSDGTNGLQNSGWITWQRKSGEPTMFQSSRYYSYWYYIHLAGATLSDDVVISLQTMPYFDIEEAGKGVCCCMWKTRACMVFDRYPNRILVSAKDKPLVLNGSDFGILRAGDGRRNTVNCIINFKNEIVAFQEERGKEGGCVTLFEGHSPGNFGRLVLSTKAGCFNANCAVTVDGVLTSTATEEVLKSLFFFLSRYGLCVSDGRTIAIATDDIANYFDPAKEECVRRGYEDRHWLSHDTKDNVLRMALVTGTPRETGTATSTTADKLVDTAADFVTQKVVVGDTVYNTTDDTEALVTAIDDLNTLSLDTDIMVSGEAYEVYACTPNAYPVFDLTDKVFAFDDPAQDLSCMTEIEAGSGNLPVLQLGGGVADGTIYQLNYGTNDVSTAIDAYATMAINYGGLITLVRELMFRVKAQSAGNVTVTPYLNSIVGTPLTLAMTAVNTGETIRRHRQSWDPKGHNIEIKFQNNTVSQSLYLEDLGLKLITEDNQ